MFEDYCLTCGKELVDGRTYCNEVCHNGDLTSPSLSESSSAFSSPHLQYAHGQEVPPLVPSALGNPLAYDRYSASSSSASSTTWSITDDESEPEQHSRNGLSYTRRPSGTNNGRAVLHCRTGSGSLQSLSLPQSAPDDITSFDQRYHREQHKLDFDTDSKANTHLSEDPPRQQHTATVTTTKGRKKTNRASLPVYFSKLQINTNKSEASSSKASPTVASSAASTLHPRLSPPTPKVGLMAGLAATAAHAHTPRGRRPHSRTRTRDHPSPSRSHSRSPSPARRRDSEEKVTDFLSGLARGRAVRRNSSPPAKMVGPSGQSPYHLRLSISPKLIVGERGRSSSRNLSNSRQRGRARAEELDGAGQSPEHPGLGLGRSGLVGRARKGAVDEWFGIRGNGTGR